MKTLTNFILESDVNASAVEEYFGTLMQSVVECWKAHLMTESYAQHMALNEYYTQMPEKIDALIELYQGVNGKLKSFKNNILLDSYKNVIEYVDALHKFVHDRYDTFGKDSESQSALDDILTLIDSTLYKLKELK